MTEFRYVKITVTAAVAVIIREGGLADKAISKEILLDRLHSAGDWSSDGRKNFSVEQLHAAAETIVRNAIERVLDDDLRQGQIRDFMSKSGSVSRRAYELFEQRFAQGMTGVHEHETPVNDKHVLTFNIEERIR